MIKKKNYIRQNNIPLYVRIESLIRNKILNGQFEPGEKLPKEEELIAQFQVSQITIRNALACLEREGLIIRNRGKGTFVAKNVPVKEKFVITNEVYNILQDAGKYEVKNIEILAVEVGETRRARALRQFFGFGSNEEAITVVKRTRYYKGVPVYCLENYLRPEMREHLTINELAEKPLLKILKEKIGLAIGKGEMYIEAMPADPDIAYLLRTQVFEPIILRELIYWLPSGEPFEIVDSFMRPDYFRYKVDVAVTEI
jgi:GntR family transcriptional regulator